MRIRYQVMLLAVIVFGVYYPAIFAPLSLVDDPGLYQYLLNSDLHLRELFVPGGGGYYRPLLFVTFLMDKHLWGLEESFMHLDNILLHLCNTLLVLALARRICRVSGWSCAGAFFAALFFAVHPIQTESVTWISGRTDPLAACFLLLSVLVLLYRDRPLASSVLSALCLLLACLVKETAIFYLPAALVFPFFLPENKEASFGVRAALLRHLPHFVVFLATGGGYFLFRRLAFPRGDEGVAQVVTSVASAAAQQTPTLLPNIRLTLKVIGFYARKLIEPFPLNFGASQVPDGYLVVGLAVLGALAFLVLRRSRSLITYCWVSAASVGSSAILIAFLNTTWTPLAERYLYIPSTFFLIGITLSIQQSAQLGRCRSPLIGAALVLAAGFGYSSFTRNLLWQDNLAFFEDTVRKSPGFQPARNQLAIALMQKGRVREAEAIFKSFRPDPGLKNYQYGLIGKAAGYQASGDFQTARSILLDALKSPGRHEASILESVLSLNAAESARDHARSAALSADSVQRLTRLYQITGDPFHQYRLGLLNLKENRRPQALAALREVCRTAGPDVYYRKPAEKLVAALARPAGHATEGVEKQ